MPRAVAYIRASTADQTQTLDAQRERIAAWAEREGVEVVAYHVDAGVSGTTPAHKRTGLTDALLDVETHRADLLVVTTRDRLARSALDAALLDRDLAKLKARVVAVDGDAASNADTDEGRLVRTILDAVAEYEAARTRARTRAVLRHRRQQGLRTGGRLPYGFDELEGRLIPYEPEQNALRRLYELSDAGMSQRRIATILDAERWPTRGEKWHRSLVRRLLERRAENVPAAAEDRWVYGSMGLASRQDLFPEQHDQFPQARISSN
ncbi:MAG: recombinase family protein [Nannocystales bacterium]